MSPKLVIKIGQGDPCFGCLVPAWNEENLADMHLIVLVTSWALFGKPTCL